MLRVLEKTLEQNGTNGGIFERSWMAWFFFDLQSLKAFHHISMCFMSYPRRSLVSSGWDQDRCSTRMNLGRDVKRFFASKLPGLVDLDIYNIIYHISDIFKYICIYIIILYIYIYDIFIYIYIYIDLNYQKKTSRLFGAISVSKENMVPGTQLLVLRSQRRDVCDPRLHRVNGGCKDQGCRGAWGNGGNLVAIGSLS